MENTIYYTVDLVKVAGIVICVAVVLIYTLVYFASSFIDDLKFKHRKKRQQDRPRSPR